jgi:hypothetical protein
MVGLASDEFSSFVDGSNSTSPQQSEKGMELEGDGHYSRNLS